MLVNGITSPAMKQVCLSYIATVVSVELLINEHRYEISRRKSFDQCDKSSTHCLNNKKQTNDLCLKHRILCIERLGRTLGM